MAGKSISAYVDEPVAIRLSALAQAEARSPAWLAGQAISFYTALPESARVSLRRIELVANFRERRWFQAELVRLLLKADMQITQRQMAEEIGAGMPKVASEAEADRAALEWLQEPVV